MPAASTKSKSKSRTTSADAPRLVYVYCAVEKPVAPRLLAALPAMPDGGAPRAVDLNKDVALIVADVDAAKYHSTAIEAGLSDLDWVSRCGAAHHAVADALVPKHTVVPFRMFTLFESEASARKTLSAATRGITRALARVRDKSEWVLRIGVPDPGRASGEGAQPTTASATSGTSFLAQKAAAKRTASERATRVRHEAQEVFESVE